MSESFIHPTNVKYPFTEKDDKLYSLTEIARGIGCKGEETNALDHSGRNPIPVQDLLLCDPCTTDSSTGLLRDLFSEKHSMDEEARKQALESLNSESKVVTILCVSVMLLQYEKTLCFLHTAATPWPAVKSEVTCNGNYLL